MNNETFLKAKLVEVGWWHGHPYGGTDNAMAAMFVARNRFNAGWGDWASVIGQLAGDNVMPPLSDSDFRFLLQNVDSIFDGSMPDKLTEGALWFGDLSHGEIQEVANLAKQTKIPCAKIGPVSFFK